MKILVGIDGSRYSLAAVRFITRHLSRPGLRVHLIHALADADVPFGRTGASAAAAARQRRAAPQTWLREAQTRLDAHGFKVRTELRSGTPSRVIPTQAARGGYDLVVVGAKGRSDVPFLDIGSVALATLEHAGTNVLMVRERQPERRKKQLTTTLNPLSVMFATDGGPHSLEAIRIFFALFEPQQLRALAVAVAEEPGPEALRRLSRTLRESLLRRIRETGEQWLREAAELLEEQGVRPQVRLLTGRPATALVAAAARRTDGLLVLGSRAAARAESRLGSVALEVARMAPCSVLIARRAVGPG